MGISVDDIFICVWNYHIMFVNEKLTAKQWEYIVREVGEYPYPHDLTFYKIERPEDMPEYRWEYRLFGEHPIKLLVVHDLEE